jgi:hypothetical protein
VLRGLWGDSYRVPEGTIRAGVATRSFHGMQSRGSLLVYLFM